jgi:hypothetical protein
VSVFGYSLANWAAIAFRFSVACCGVTPGFSRPSTVSGLPVRFYK